MKLPTQDTLIASLYEICQLEGKQVDPALLFGLTGMGTRFSLAMNTKTAREIGHPSSHYIWDVVGVIQHCFNDAGIDCTAYVGPGYASSARTTAAQTERELPENVIVLKDYTLDSLPLLNGYVIYAEPTGQWKLARNSEQIDLVCDELPFGPVVLHIHSIDPQLHFPVSTLRYIIDTIERGEEPMEIRGRNNYSTVSGWKAYARWMQSYSVPLPGVQHDHLSSFVTLLLERRTFMVAFLKQLATTLEGESQQLISDLANRYQSVVDVLSDLDSSPSFSQVRDCYFTEQKTQVTYKKLDTLLTQKNY